jgi:hypothetical protein
MNLIQGLHSMPCGLVFPVSFNDVACVCERACVCPRAEEVMDYNAMHSQLLSHFCSLVNFMQDSHFSMHGGSQARSDWGEALQLHHVAKSSFSSVQIVDER